MRAPRWVRDFFGWRWAPFVALVAASLSVALSFALLVPAQFETAPRRVDESPSFVRANAVVRPSAPQEPLRFVVASAPPPSAPPEVTLPNEPEPAAPPSPSPAPEPTTAVPVDFAANIADRADRPHAPAARFSGH